MEMRIFFYPIILWPIIDLPNLQLCTWYTGLNPILGTLVKVFSVLGKGDHTLLHYKETYRRQIELGTLVTIISISANRFLSGKSC